MSNQESGEKKRKIKRKKRKANSPLNAEDIACKVSNLNQPGSTQVNTGGLSGSGHNVLSTGHCVSTPNTSYVSMASPIGNFPQPFFGFTPNSHQMMYPTSNTESIPAWASVLIDDVKSLKLSIQKVEKTTDSTNAKVTAMENRLKTLENKVDDVEKSCQFISGEFDKHQSELNNAKDQIKLLETSCRNLESVTKTLEKQKTEMNNKLIDLESRSMRDNLIFYGVPEPSEPDNAEDCGALVKEIITNKMGLDGNSMLFDRAHRLISNNPKRPRAIVVKFHYHTQREQVRQRSYNQDVKKALQDAKLGVGIQQPQAVRDGRRAFYDIIKENEERGNRVRVNGLKLYVNGRLHKVYSEGKVVDPPPYMLPSTR